MQRSRLPLVILILALGCALCLCATVTGFAVFQVIRNVTEIEMPQMRALLPPVDDPDFAPAVEPETSPLPSVGRAAAGVDRIVAQGGDGILYTMTPDGADRVALTERGTGLRVFRQPSWSPDATPHCLGGDRRRGWQPGQCGRHASRGRRGADAGGHCGPAALLPRMEP